MKADPTSAPTASKRTALPALQMKAPTTLTTVPVAPFHPAIPLRASLEVVSGVILAAGEGVGGAAQRRPEGLERAVEVALRRRI